MLQLNLQQRTGHQPNQNNVPAGNLFIIILLNLISDDCIGAALSCDR